MALLNAIVCPRYTYPVYIIYLSLVLVDVDVSKCYITLGLKQ